MGIRNARPLGLCLFFLTGVSGLMYEILWARMLKDVVGSTTGATSAVVAAFMAGLMLGSFFLGRLGDRFKNPFAVYGICEICIGLSALIVTFSLDRAGFAAIRLFGAAVGEGPLSLLVRFSVVLGFLIVPTSLMGMSLPVLSKLFLSRSDRIGFDLSGLSAVNGGGAVVGSILSGFFMLRFIGLHGAITLTALLNAIVGIVAIFASLPGRGDAPRVDVPSVRPIAEGTPAKPKGIETVIFIAMGLSGFASFGYEILWTRALSVSFGNSTYAFSTLLTAFLIGIGLGNLIVRLASRRIKNPVRAFAFLQIAIALAAALSLFLLVKVFCTPQVLGSFSRNTSWGLVMILRFGGALTVMCIPASLIGATFPIAGMVFVKELSHTSARIGALSAINTLGNSLGTLAPSLLIIPLIGITKGVLALCCVNLAVGIFVIVKDGGRPRLSVCGPVLCAGLVLTISFLPPLFRFPSDTESADDRILYYKEGISATTMVYEKQDTGEKHMSVDGIYIGGTGGTEQKEQLLAHIPKLFLEGPYDELTVGLGSGILAGESALHDELRSLTCVEIAETVIEGASYFRDENHAILQSPKAHVLLADGVQYLRSTGERWDIISTDSKSRPTAQGNGTFFSTDYFTLVRDHLTDRGIAIQWFSLHFPLTAIKSALHSFVEVFPYAYLWYFSDTDAVLMGTKAALNMDLAGIDSQLMAKGNAFDDLRSYGVTSASSLWGGFVASRSDLERATRSAPLNSFEHPRIEFYPMREYAQSTNALITENIAFLASLRTDELAMNELETLPTVQKANVMRSFDATSLCMQGLELAYGLSAETGRIEKLFDDALTTAPTDERVRYCVSRYDITRALRRLEAGQLTDAVAYLDKARTLFPAGADAWYLLGVVYGNLGLDREAVDTLSRAVSLLPSSPSFRQALVLALARAGKLGMVEEQLRAMLADNPENLFALTNMGLYLAERDGSFGESLAYFRHALLVHPHDPELLGYLIWYTYRSGDVATARHLVSEAGSYAKGDPEREKQRALIMSN